jgi:hypothetical protein
MHYALAQAARLLAAAGRRRLDLNCTQLSVVSDSRLQLQFTTGAISN